MLNTGWRLGCRTVGLSIMRVISPDVLNLAIMTVWISIQLMETCSFQILFYNCFSQSVYKRKHPACSVYMKHTYIHVLHRL